MITLPKKDIEIAKKVIPNIEELMKDENNAEELVLLLNDAMIETMDENDIPSDFGSECERIMDDINYRYCSTSLSEKEKRYLEYSREENKPNTFNVVKFCDLAINIAKDLGFILDYSVKSLEDVEKIIQIFREDNRDVKEDDKENNTAIWNMSVIFGTYVGEVCLMDGLAKLGYSWDTTEDIPMIKNFDNNGMNPIGKVNKKIKDKSDGAGYEESIPSFYRIFTTMINTDFSKIPVEEV